MGTWFAASTVCFWSSTKTMGVGVDDLALVAREHERAPVDAGSEREAHQAVVADATGHGGPRRRVVLAARLGPEVGRARRLLRDAARREQERTRQPRPSPID